MNHTQQAKIEVLIDKINLIYANIKDQEEISPMDVKLLKKYAGEFNDYLQDISESGSSKPNNDPKDKGPSEKAEKTEILREAPSLEKRMVDEEKGKQEEEKPTPGSTISFLDRQKEEHAVEGSDVPKPVEGNNKEKKNDVDKVKQAAKAYFTNAENEEEAFEDLSLNARFKQEQKLLGDKLKRTSLDLRTDVDLNDKFWFINNLFDGDAEDYQRAISQINSCNTYSEARSMIDTQLIPKYNWKENERPANKFLELVQRKFDQAK